MINHDMGPIPPLNTLGHVVVDGAGIPFIADVGTPGTQPCVPVWPSPEAAGLYRDTYFPQGTVTAIAMIPLLVASAPRPRRRATTDRRIADRDVPEAVLGSDFEEGGDATGHPR